MRPRAFNRTLVLACSLSICLTASQAKATEDAPDETKDDCLSVRESLLPMFSFAFRSSNEFFPIRRINPAVRPYIRFYLENDNSRYDYVAGGIWLLGVVGTEDDIDFVDEYVQSLLNSSGEDNKGFRPNSDSVAGAIGCFAGMMLHRDLQGAEEFVRKYAEVSAWVFSEAADEAELTGAYNYFILGAYEYSKADFILRLLRQASSGSRPFLRRSALEALESRKQSKYVEMMKASAKSEETLKKYRMDFLNRNGEWIDILLRKQTLAQWREAHEKEKAAARTQKKRAGSFESVDMSETVEGGYVKAIARDATNAFEKVSRTALGRNARDMPIKKEILRDIHKAGLNDYDAFEVTVDVEATIDDFVALIGRSQGKNEVDVTEPTVAKKKEAAAVTFRILGTADIVKRHGLEAGAGARVSPTTGDVIVPMKRVGDTWYWGSTSSLHVGAIAGVVDDDYLIENVRAAVLAYERISRMLADGDYDLLTIPVLDNGELIPLEKRKKDKDEMARALDMEKKVLQELRKARLNTYGDYQIKVKFDATLGRPEARAETDATPPTIRGYEIADVTFAIRNAAEAYKKHAPERSGYESLDGAGNLQVAMKRINGKWYWNPFGW